MKDFSKTIVCLVIGLNIAFTVAIYALFWHTSNEPSTLIGGWFAFTSTELWSLASIKKKKIREGELYDERTDYSEIDEP